VTIYAKFCVKHFGELTPVQDLSNPQANQYAT